MLYAVDGVRAEGEKRGGSIPAIRCKVGKVSKEAGWEIENIEKQYILICGSGDHKVITTKEGTKRTLKSFNTSSFNVHSISPLSTQPYPGTPLSMVSALYGILAASSSSKNQEGVVWVPGVVKGLEKRYRCLPEKWTAI